MAGRDLANLVEEERPAVGLLEAALAPADRARERALLVAEELALEERLGERRAVELHEGRLSLRGAVLVDRLRDELLARPALAGDEHARLGRRDLLDDVEDRLHCRARADDVVEAEPLLQARAELRRFALEATALQRAVDDDEELVELDGLGEVVLGPLLHGLHGRVDVRERGHQDDDELRDAPRAPARGAACRRAPACEGRSRGRQAPSPEDERALVRRLPRPPLRTPPAARATTSRPAPSRRRPPRGCAPGFHVSPASPRLYPCPSPVQNLRSDARPAQPRAS